MLSGGGVLRIFARSAAESTETPLPVAENTAKEEDGGQR
jgi:hypothetical protein